MVASSADPMASSSRTPTEEQRLAVEADLAKVFVSAGAGSGKTSLLVERYLRALLRDHLALNDVPTVTFTRKAAGEMRRRIREELLARGEGDLAWALDSAPIGTIHGLCSRILRAHALEGGVDPRFSVLEEERSDILLEEAFADAWDRRSSAAEISQLAIMARHQSDLETSVLDLYRALRQRGEAVPRLRLPQPCDPMPAIGRLVEAIDVILGAAGSFGSAKTATKNAALLVEHRDWVAAAAHVGEWRELERLARLRPTMSVGGLRHLFDPLMEALADAIGALGESYVAGLAAAVDALLVDVDRAYRSRKLAAGALDFSDLEILTLDLLQRGVRPLGADSLLLVDEFQDTNGLQWDILQCLGATAVLTVGDRQQSIYGFRGADVEVFKGLQAEVEAGSRDAGVVVPLTVNFRSTPAVLAGINRIFSGMELFGDEFAELHPPATSPGSRGGEGAGPAVEIVVVDTRAGAADTADTDAAARYRLEARVVAGRVGDLVRSGEKPRDIVVLLRAFTHVATYEQALREAGLPVYVVGGRGFYEREELSDMLALLRVLVNPYDDYSLAVVLRSPLGRFSDDVLFLTREEAKVRGRRFLWEVLAEATPPGVLPAEADRLQAFVSSISSLRRRVGTPGLASLLDDAVSTLDYDLVLLAAPDGHRRYANLRKLMRLADDFESLEGPDLVAFVRYLETRKDLDASREGNAPVLAEQDDVVRVMTVHQAKGLEFPLVIVGGLAGTVRPDTGSFLVGRTGEAAVHLPGPGSMSDVRLSLGPVDLLTSERAGRERAEVVRLYYVAATRAEARLLLVGAPAIGAADRCDNPLAWMLASVGLMPSQVLEGGVGESRRPEPGLDLVVVAAAPPPVEEPGMVDRSLAAGRPAAVHNVPPPPPLPESPRRLGITQVSFSSLSEYAECPRRFYLRHVLRLRADVMGDDKIDRALVVDTLSEGGEPGGWRRGVAVHAALESLRLAGQPSDLEIDAAVARGLGAIAPATVDADEVARLTRAFFESPLVGLPGLDAARTEEYFVFAHRGLLVTGFIDVIGGERGSWWVVDHKTNRLAGRRPDEAMEPYRLQQVIYALAALQAGAESVDVCFLFLESPAEPVVVRFAKADVPDLESALDSALSGLEQGLFPVGDGCALCDVAGTCETLALEGQAGDRGGASGCGEE